MEKLGPRRAELLYMRNPGVGTVRMRLKIPARGLLGYRSEFVTDSRGTGVMHHRFFQYGPWAGPLSGRSRGVMVADREGVTVRMRFKIPARGLLGYRSEFLTDTRGTGVMHHRFFQYGPWAGPLSGRSRGVMVADREGVTVRMRFKIPARGLLGYRSEFLTDTRGTGVMHHRFFQYGPWAGPLSG